LAPAQQKARSRSAVAGWVRILLWELDRHIKDSRRRAMRVVVMPVMMAAKAHRFLG
jgi:hypothetical protein